VTVMVTSCGPLPAQQKTTHQGKPVTYWEDLTLDTSMAAREQAANALGDILRGQQVVSAKTTRCLGRAVHDPAKSVRLKAIEAAGRAGRPSAEIVYPLRRALQDSDPEISEAAGRAFQQIAAQREPAITAQISRLASSQRDERASAALALSTLGPAAAAAVTPLIGLLDDEEAIVRRNALLALTMIGPAAEPAIAKLIEQDQSAQGDDARQAIEALGAIGPSAKIATADLLKAFEKEPLRIESSVLLFVDPDGKEWIPPVAKLLAASAVEQRHMAADTVRYAMRTAQESSTKSVQNQMVQLLLLALADEDRKVRWCGAQGLSEFWNVPESASPALEHALDDKFPEVHEAAAVALRKMVPAGFKALRQAVDSKQPNTRRIAYRQLVSAMSFSWRDFVEAIGQDDSQARQHLVSSVQVLELAESELLLDVLGGLGHEDAEIRSSAARQLASLAGRIDRPVLLAGVRTDEMIALRDRGVAAISAIKTKLKDFEAPLKTALQDSDPGVREQAAIALKLLNSAE
jgi:HEAT repeat protein